MCVLEIKASLVKSLAVIFSQSVAGLLFCAQIPFLVQKLVRWITFPCLFPACLLSLLSLLPRAAQLRQISAFGVFTSEHVLPVVSSRVSWCLVLYLRDFPGGSDGKRLSTMWEAWVRSLGSGSSLEKEMATHSSTLA